MAAGTDALEFISVDPNDHDYLRGIVLFGVNVATYKFALAKAVLELAAADQDTVPMADLAVPFARHLCEHIERSPKQTTSRSSTYLDVCRRFTTGEVSEDELMQQTVKLGFNNVIDAFHRVGPADVPVRFFEDARRGATPGIRLTDAARKVAQSSGSNALLEVEARWRLVETAWDLDMSTTLVAYDDGTGDLLVGSRRRSVTSARNALNGYQKGRCFYCYRDVEVLPGSADLAEVDHLFPHALQRRGVLTGLDGVWNLVLACVDCNRGPYGKWDAVPGAQYVKRLQKRNDYLIASHHPLRETLIRQTGESAHLRHRFLQHALDNARRSQPRTWSTPSQGDPTF